MSSGLKPPDDTERRFLFSRQVRFNANEKLAEERSHNFPLPKPIPERDIWKRRPPDFSLRVNRSLNLPRRPAERENVRNNLTEVRREAPPPCGGDVQGEVRREAPPPQRSPSRQPPRFLTRFKPLEPYEANILYVKHGVYQKDRYQDPRPHDYRQYEPHIPDFVTSFSRDPFNLKFRTQGLSSSCEFPAIEDTKNRAKVKRFIVHKSADPQWDPKLILPTSPWPAKSASYTRHRRRRGVYSAFMDRVEEKFAADNQEVSPIRN